MNLPSNLFDENVNVQVFLCQPDKTIIGEILPYESNGTLKFNTYSEISFNIDKYYIDLIDGKTKINPYYHLIESLRVIYLRGIGHFVIQDIGENESDTYSKSVTCFSLEYSTGQKYLENFYVNTGEEGSIETMYHAQKYGAEYSIDTYYTEVNKGSDKFDPYERYYIKDYSNDGDVSYNYVETQILNDEDYQSYEFDLYVKKYPNVRFYWPTKPELSLLHNVFNLIPEWKIGHVDKELWYQERTFSEDRTAVYDFLYNTAADTLDFVMVWDSVKGVCHFYKTEEDGIVADRYIRTGYYSPDVIYYVDNNGTKPEIQPTKEQVINGEYYINIGQDIETQWDTDVFISRENLAEELDISYSTDDIKTKLKITGSDDLDVRDVNLGQSYIMDLSYYATDEWMGEGLHIRYDEYTTRLNEWTQKYKQYMSDWSASYNQYNDLMNNVPAEPSVLLVGDEFDKLHCIYSQYVPATKYISEVTYYSDMYGTEAENQPTSDTDFTKEKYYIIDIASQVKVLKEQLNIYKVDINNGVRSKTAKTDDVLLTLSNNDSDSITIRVRHNQDADTEEANKDYRIYRTYTSVSTGISNTIYFTLEEWVGGKLTADYKVYRDDGVEYAMNADGFTVKSIGTLGAYMCIAKDEKVEENLQDYGIKLLEEKKDTYTKIFITQTESYMSEDGYQCIASATMPDTKDIGVGTKWLNLKPYDDGKLHIYEFDGNNWNKDVTNEINDTNEYEDYARFYENYQKLQAVQKVLDEKQKYANYLLNGFDVNSMYLTNQQVTLGNLVKAAILHFVVGSNDYYVSVSEPVGTFVSGDIWFKIDSDTNNIMVMKRTENGWSLVSDNMGHNFYIIDFDFDTKYGYGYTTFYYNPTWIQATEFTTGTIYYVLNNGKYEQAIHQPSEDTDFTSNVYYFTNDLKYAVYVNNGTPYVSYSNSQGLPLAKMNYVKNLSDINNNFEDSDLLKLSPFIREDEYNDNNFLLTSYESEEEQMSIKQSLLDRGKEELKKICKPKLSFKAPLANILAIPEFKPLRRQFKLGNFIRVLIREGEIKRTRILEVQINFDDASDFSVTFGDLISTKTEIDKHAELLEQAVTVSKSVASNSSNWQKGADVATSLEKRINEGLQDAVLEVGKTENQSITWDSNGIWGKKIDPTTGEVDLEQFRLVNNRILFSDDGFRTSKGLFGKFTIKDENGNDIPHWGVLSDAVISGYIEGSSIKGGELEIGGEGGIFRVHKNGSVEILTKHETPIYATKSDVDLISYATKYRVELSYSGNTVFNTSNQTCTVTCTVYDGTDLMSDELLSEKHASFSWYLNGNLYKETTNKQITIGNDAFMGTTLLNCQVTFDE